MRAFPASILLLPLCAALLPAQEPQGQPDTTPQQETPEQELTRLRKEIGAAQRAAIEAYQQKVAAHEKAIERGEIDADAPRPAFSMQDVIDDFVPKFRDAAQRYQGSDDAVPFLLFLLGNDAEHEDEVLATLMHDHVASAAFAPVVDMLRYKTRSFGEDKVQEMLASVLANNEHGEVQAAVRLARAQLVLERREAPTPEEKSAALDDLRQAVKLAESDETKGRAEGALFEQEHLQPGMTVPDIVGQDLDGRPLRLSDTRGKVVLLDFWGDW